MIISSSPISSIPISDAPNFIGTLDDEGLFYYHVTWW